DGPGGGIDEAGDADADHLRLPPRGQGLYDGGDAVGQGGAASGGGGDFEAVGRPAGESPHPQGGPAHVHADPGRHRRITPNSSRMTMAAAPASTGSATSLAEDRKSVV